MMSESNKEQSDSVLASTHDNINQFCFAFVFSLQMKSIFQLAIPPYSFKEKYFRMKCQTSITIPAAIPKPEIFFKNLIL